jgi:hypothetical protein
LTVLLVLLAMAPGALEGARTIPMTVPYSDTSSALTCWTKPSEKRRAKKPMKLRPRAQLRDRLSMSKAVWWKEEEEENGNPLALVLAGGEKGGLEKKSSSVPKGERSPRTNPTGLGSGNGGRRRGIRRFRRRRGVRWLVKREREAAAEARSAF